jgi:integrase
MASIREKGPYQFHVQIRKKGYPATTRTFLSRDEAEDWATVIESEMIRGIFQSTAEAEKTTLCTALERYEREVLPTKKGRQPDKSRIKTLKQWLGSLKLAAITSASVASFRDGRLKEVSEQSVIHEINLLNRVLKTAVIDWGIALPSGIPTAMIRKPKKPQGRDRRASQEEINAIVSETESNELAGIVLMAAETAMRRGEIGKIQWHDVDLKKQVLVIHDTKNGDRRAVALSMKAVSVLKSLPRRIDGRVFGLQPESISQAFERARNRARSAYEKDCEKTGKAPDRDYLVGLRFHDLRHEAASRLFEKGLNPMEVASITGHKTLQMLKRYTHLRAEDLAKKLG